MKILDFLHNTKTQAILSFLIVSGTGILLVWGHLSEGINNRILDIALLTATFYFGSSKSGADKDKVISDNLTQPTVNTASNVNIDQTTQK